MPEKEPNFGTESIDEYGNLTQLINDAESLTEIADWLQKFNTFNIEPTDRLYQKHEQMKTDAEKITELQTLVSDITTKEELQAKGVQELISKIIFSLSDDYSLKNRLLHILPKKYPIMKEFIFKKDDQQAT
jgi:predicted O-linked N-acetylglucosamine transferase (SPINDLY family)